MSLDLSAYKPQTGTTSDATAISNAFTACEADSASLWTQTNTNTASIAALGGASVVVPPGAMVEYGGTAAPSGWLMCDGSTVSRTTYASLFAAVSTRFGVGDGSTTFNLPDFRGRVAVGYAASGGHTDVSTIGNAEAGVALANRTPKHNSTNSLNISPNPHSHSYNYPAFDVTGQSGSDAYRYNGVTIPTTSATTSLTIGGTIGPGGTRPIDTPAYLVCARIIKT